MITAISVITRTGYNAQIRLDLGARYVRFLQYKKNPRKKSEAFRYIRFLLYNKKIREKNLRVFLDGHFELSNM